MAGNLVVTQPQKDSQAEMRRGNSRLYQPRLTHTLRSLNKNEHC